MTDLTAQRDTLYHALANAASVLEWHASKHDGRTITGEALREAAKQARDALNEVDGNDD